MTTLLQYWDLARFDVTLCVLDAQAVVYRDRIPSGVNFVDLGSGRVRYSLFRLVRLVWRLQPDVVFSFLGYLNIALAGIKLFFPAGVKVLGRETAVVGEHLAGGSFRLLWEFAYRLLYSRLDGVICQSTDMRNDLVLRYGFPESRATLIHNPVDIDYVRALSVSPCPEMAISDNASRKKISLVAAGRLEQQKGFDLLIEAIALCSDPRLHLYLLGTGSQADSLGMLARSLGIEGQITFVGFQPNPYAWFARADAMVLSSRYEGFPNVVIEALACGTPVIATPAPGGVREILAQVPMCEMAEDISARSLADAILRLVKVGPKRLGDDVVSSYAAIPIVREYEKEVLRVAAQNI